MVVHWRRRVPETPMGNYLTQEPALYAATRHGSTCIHFTVKSRTSSSRQLILYLPRHAQSTIRSISQKSTVDNLRVSLPYVLVATEMMCATVSNQVVSVLLKMMVRTGLWSESHTSVAHSTLRDRNANHTHTGVWRREYGRRFQLHVAADETRHIHFAPVFGTSPPSPYGQSSAELPPKSGGMHSAAATPLSCSR